MKNNVMEESTVRAEAETSGRAVPACCMSAEEMGRKFDRGLKEAKAAVEDKFEDGKREAQRFVKRSRFAMEDKVLDSAYRMKKNPGTTLAAAFAAGAMLGFLIPRLGKR
ncbi:MAG: hypothetical protein ABL995_12625 [Bryobacteraceae bacterium]